MERRALAWGSALMALGVALGAFGAHGLKAALSPADLAVWHTALQYHFLHALGLLLLAALGERVPARQRSLAAWAFLVGTLCFSGSLYVLSTKDITGLAGSVSWLGPITPLGGSFFIAGWTVLLITALKGTDQR
jgi:uncharacterized membrane protein YgdD (TMEM256/DUF423 family)